MLRSACLLLVAVNVAMLAGCTPVRFTAQKVCISLADASTGAPVPNARLSHRHADGSSGSVVYERRECGPLFADVRRTTDLNGQALLAFHANRRCEGIPVIAPQCGPPYPRIDGKTCVFEIATERASETLALEMRAGHSVAGESFLLSILSIGEPFALETRCCKGRD
jgi:hypothetical protein